MQDTETITPGNPATAVEPPPVKYRGLTVMDQKYCWGHSAHRSSRGGRVLGGMKLWYCAECAAARLSKKGQPK